MTKAHVYTVTVEWTGNRGTGTSSYRAYERRHEIGAGDTKLPIAGSSDPAFMGDSTLWNPEELFVGSVAACHKLWYLHLCAEAGVVVTAYIDRAQGTMREDADGGGRFIDILLRPEVTIAPGSDSEKAHALHVTTHEKCFIANSVNFPVRFEPRIKIAEASAA